MTSDRVHPGHVALHVDVERLAAVVTEPRLRRVPFGNDPGDLTTSRTDDPLGGPGRVCFTDLDGRLIEIVAG